MLVNMHEAKTHLSRLVERVAAGEEIVIGRAGKPVARLVPYEEEEPAIFHPFGLAKGRIWVSDDFDDNSDIIEAFEESINRPFPE